MKNFIQYSIYFEPFNIDLVSGALWELDILGINEFDNFITVFTNERSTTNKEVINSCLNDLVEEKNLISFRIQEDYIENRNWNEEWENKLQVIEVSDRIIVKPSFREYNSHDNQIVLIIDPKMSFGTGEHQTTKLVLQLLEKYLVKGDKVLDVGSGTAVLGIAASKLGADRVFCVDNDEWCYLNGLENVERNNLNNLTLVQGTINNINENDFSFITANINKNVLLEIKSLLYQKLNNKGILVLSGILKSDAEEIERQFTGEGLTALEIKQLDEWISIVFKKN